MERIKEALARTEPVGRQIARQAVGAAFGFLLSRTTLFAAYAPFGLAAAAGAPPELATATAIGAAVGYFFPVSGVGGFRYLAAVVAIALIRFLLPRAWQDKEPALFGGGTALAAGTVTTAVVLLTGGVKAMTLLTLAIELLASAGTAYFVAVAAQAAEALAARKRLTAAQTVSVVLTVGLVLMAFAAFTIAGVSLAGVVGLFLILAAARYGGERGGALAGVTLGFAMLLTGGDTLWLTGAFAMGGLMAGLFSALHVAAGVAALDVVILFFALRAGLTDHLPLLWEAGAASAISLLLPRRWQTPLGAVFAPPPEMPRLDGLRKAVTLRLSFASEALRDVSRTVDEAAHRLGEIRDPDFEGMLAQVEEDACAVCALRRYCWEENAAEIAAELTLLTKEEIAPSRAGPTLTKVCSHLDRVCGALDARYRALVRQRAAKRRVDEVREVLMDQFGGMSDMLYDMACDMERDRRYDFDAAGRVDTALRGIGVYPTDVGCSLDGEGRFHVEIRVQAAQNARFNRMDILRAVSTACERTFDPPCIQYAHGCALLCLSEKAAFVLDVGAFQLALGDGRFCGDARADFEDGRGRRWLLLCDGMGAGGRAAVDATMAAALMERLLKAGFGCDCALKLANAAMRFKSTEESLATVDLCGVDLFSGRVELYKAGACPTVFLRGGRTARAACASLPAGIVGQVGFDSAAVMLHAGDVIVMMSDGATAEGTDWICAEVEAWKGRGSAQQLAEHLARSARRRRQDGHDDDITVQVAVLEKAPV